jgi:predicted ATPase
VISEIKILNFKSVADLTLKPGRVTVLIGENGSGKSNILEAIAFAAGAAANKLDNEFLFNRGIRVVEEAWMRSAFPKPSHQENNLPIQDPIVLSISGAKEEPIFNCRVFPVVADDDKNFLEWNVQPSISKPEIEGVLKSEKFSDELKLVLDRLRPQLTGPHWSDDSFRELAATICLVPQKKKQLGEDASKLGLADFMIYTPENTTLRTPPPESAIQPLGVKGEGLLKLLQSFNDQKSQDRLTELKGLLHLFGWFEDFNLPDDSETAQARLQIRDRWLTPKRAVFDQRSASEGFLYLLFYFALLVSSRTPKFFALDNVDNALNPKLCSVLMKKIVELAKKYEKQVICTTHNPALLDGLNLKDDEQRLYTVRRDSDGHTVVRRVDAPEPQKPNELPVRLSEAFLRGIIGGLPDHF